MLVLFPFIQQTYYLTTQPTPFCLDLVTSDTLLHGEEQTFPTGLTVCFSLFFVGMAGVVYNPKSFLVTMMCIEMMYLGAITGFIFYGVIHHDITAAIYALLILIFAACESAVGLGLLVVARTYEDTLEVGRFVLLGG